MEESFYVHRSKDKAQSSPSGGKGALASVLNDTFDIRQAMGGIRGVSETIIPPLLFIVIYMLTSHVGYAALASVGVSLTAILVRLVQKIDLVPALSGLFAVVFSAVWAWKSGQASNYFTLGLITNAVYLTVLLLSLIVRFPLMGVIIGFLRGDMSGWKKGEKAHSPNQKLTRKRYTQITWLWLGLFAVRLAVQLPLFYAGAVTSLGIARIVMGPFLFAFALWLTWMIVRSLPPVAPTPEKQSDPTEKAGFSERP